MNRNCRISRFKLFWLIVVHLVLGSADMFNVAAMYTHIKDYMRSCYSCLVFGSRRMFNDVELNLLSFGRLGPSAVALNFG